MSKKDDALRLALEALEWLTAAEPGDEPPINEAIAAIREALAEQPAQGCEFCSHPLYAGTKCKNCGREQSAQQEPKIGCVNHDCDKCKAQQQQEPVATIRALANQCAALIQERDELQKQIWRYEKNGVTCQTYRHKVDSTCSECNVQENYTSPQPAQPSKPWVGLTQKDIDIAFDDTQEGGGFDDFARAIEAKLREKNAPQQSKEDA